MRFLTGMVYLAAAAALPAPAQSPASSPWSRKGFDFSGNVDAYYSVNFNRPGSALNQLRNFDTQSNRPALSMARFSVERQSGPVGFRVDLGTGRGYNVFHATEVDLGDSVWRHLPQAYVSVRPIKGKAVQVDFGKFYTSAGAELTDTHLNWNYSRSLLFANGPYYHFGMRVAAPVTSKWTTGFQLVNGWNNVKDLNESKSFGITNSFTVSKKVTIANVIYLGPEKVDTTQGWRQFVDTVITVNPSDKTAFYLNYDFGSDKRLDGGRNQFQGIAGAFRYQLSKKWAVSPRLEWYQDRDGFITGTPQSLKEGTGTLEYRATDWALFRFEYRRDQSSQPYFEHRDGEAGARRSMNTLLAGLVVYWGPKK